VLFIEDLLDLYDAAVAHANVATGQIYNVGGGPENTLSIWTETGPLLERLVGHSLPVKYTDWRPGDQRVYISNINRAHHDLGWSPKIHVKEGVDRLYQWVINNKNLFE
jgi:CDP-paratose 2-epimerase